MCYYEQTQYLGCGHNIETVTECCDIGKYKSSMHDKIITAIRSSDSQCSGCNTNPLQNDERIDLTQDSGDSYTYKRRDSIAEPLWNEH